MVRKQMFEGEKTLGNEDKRRLILKIKVLKTIHVIGSAPHTPKQRRRAHLLFLPQDTLGLQKRTGTSMERRLAAGKNLQLDAQQKTGLRAKTCRMDRIKGGCDSFRVKPELRGKSSSLFYQL